MVNPDPERFSILAVVSGALTDAEGTTHQPGQFLLLPRDCAALIASDDAVVLQTTVPA